MEHLLGLYFGGLLFSLALSYALWRQHRSELNIALCWFWLAATFSTTFQGAFQEGAFPIAFGFSSSFLTNAALAHLLAKLSRLQLRWRRYIVGIVLSVGAAALVAYMDGPFWAISLPIALAVPAPTIDAAVRTLRKPDVELGTMGRALVYTSLAFAVHNLDFPFLRDRPEIAPVGFIAALFLVWALTPTSMAVVLERIAEERGRLAELEALKSRFFANISHELRTPLTLILGPVQKLIDDSHDDDSRRALQLVHRNAQRLLRLIDDLLDLSRMEAGSLELNISEVDMRSLACRTCELAEAAALSKQITIELPSDAAPATVFGDPHRLEIILTNLVGNAIKYTPSGGHVRVEVASSGNDVQVSVIDDGPGIAEEDHSSVFERFVRVGASDTGGVGIGLALSRDLAELHQGGLSFESAPGVGSTFTLRLPRRLGESAAVKAASPAARLRASERSSKPSGRVGETQRAQRRTASEPLHAAPVASDNPLPIRLEGGRVPQVLVVEDEDDLRDFIVDIVSRQFECIVAKNGAEAWAILNTERPDLILTDVMMPKMSGTELCARIKADRGLRTIPVLLLTARSGEEAAVEGYAQGADDFVAKPFHPRVLMARIRSHLTVRQLGLQLADQARLATAGSLAGGVAHEIRNPINAVLNAIEALQQTGSTVSPEQLLGVVFDGVKRIHSVVDALDAHVRPAEGGAAMPCDVRAGVETTLKLLHHRLRHLDVQVDMETGIEVMAPARAFNQVLLNLLDNALRAAQSSLRVAVRVDGEMVRLHVEDDGPGVPADLRGRVFDPFFTTREVGQGAGLGLFLSRKLARDVGGDLRCEARPEGGARFVLELPQLVPSRETDEARAS